MMLHFPVQNICEKVCPKGPTRMQEYISYKNKVILN